MEEASRRKKVAQAETDVQSLQREVHELRAKLLVAETARGRLADTGHKRERDLAVASVARPPPRCLLATGGACVLTFAATCVACSGPRLTIAAARRRSLCWKVGWLS